MKPWLNWLHAEMKSIELATCISSGIMHNLIQFVHLQIMLLECLFIIQKVFFYFSHYARELLDACLVDDVGGQPIPIDKFV